MVEAAGSKNMKWRLTAFCLAALAGVGMSHAQINPMIPLMVRPIQVPDLLQQAQQLEQIRALRLQNEQAELQRRQMEEQRALELQRNAEQQRRAPPPPKPDPVIDEWLRAAGPRMGLYPDFEQVVFAQDLAITTDMIRLMTPNPIAADIAYYLGTHKMESLAMSKMSLPEVAKSIERIEVKLKQGSLP